MVVAHILAMVPCTLRSLAVKLQVADHIQVVEPHSLEEELDSLVEVGCVKVDILGEVDSLEEELDSLEEVRCMTVGILGEVDNLEEAQHIRVAVAHNHNQVEDNRLRAAAAEVHTPHRKKAAAPASGEGTPNAPLELNEEEVLGSEEHVRRLQLEPPHGADACGKKPHAYLRAVVAHSAGEEAHQKGILCQGRAYWRPRGLAILLNVPATYHLGERSPS